MSGWPDQQDFEDICLFVPSKRKKKDKDKEDEDSSSSESEDELEKARNRAKRASLVRNAEKILADQVK